MDAALRGDIPVEFGDLITADFKIIAEHDPDNQSRDGHRTAYVMQDWYVKWLAGFPALSLIHI